jgi:hypothetical protein
MARYIAHAAAPRLVYQWLQTAQGQVAQWVPGGALLLRPPERQLRELVQEVRSYVEKYVEAMSYLEDYFKLSREYWKWKSIAATAVDKAKRAEAIAKANEILNKIRELGEKVRSLLQEAETVKLPPVIKSEVLAAIANYYAKSIAEKLRPYIARKIAGGVAPETAVMWALYDLASGKPYFFA